MGLPTMALILIHGYAETGLIFKHLIPHLNHQEIHILELPGFGIEPPPSEYSLHHYAQFIAQFLQKKNITKAHFAGHSLGGYILAELSHIQPNLFKSLTFIHSHASTDSDERKKRRSEIAKSISKFGAEPFLKLFYEGLFKSENLTSFNNVINDLLIEGYKIPSTTLIQLQHAMADRKNRLDSLEDVAFPVYFFAGIHDNLIPLEEIKQQVSQIKTAQLILSNSAHMAQFEDSNSLIAHLNSLT